MGHSTRAIFVLLLAGCVVAVAGVAMAGRPVILQICTSSHLAAVGGVPTGEILSQKQNDELKDHGFSESPRGWPQLPAAVGWRLGDRGNAFAGIALASRHVILQICIPLSCQSSKPFASLIV